MPTSAEVHEILVALAGFESDLLVATDAGAGLVLDPKYKIHDNERVLMNELASLAHLHINIRKNIATTRTSDSLVVRSVAVTVEKYATDFLRHVVDVERIILSKDPEMVFDSSISLTKVLATMMPRAKTLSHLHAVTDLLVDAVSSQGATIPALMSTLRQQTSTGYSVLKPLLNDLQTSCERMWIKQVQQWCVFGTLLSQNQHEFCVQKSQDGEYRYIAKALPSYIEQDIGRKIYEIGSTLRDLHAKVSLYASNSTESQYIDPHLDMIGRLAIPIDTIALATALHDLERSLSQNVIKTVLSLEMITNLLSVLRDYFLLENGEFAQLLIERVQDDFRSQREQEIGNLKDSTLQAVLSRTISTLALENNQAFESGQVSPALLTVRIVQQRDDTESEFSDLLFGLSASFGLKVSWPLSIFLSETDLVDYGGIFDLLIAVRRSQQLLRNLWHDRRRELKVPRTSRVTWAVAHRTIIFLESLSEHFHSQVSSFAKKCETIIADQSEVYSPSDMSTAHRIALQELKRAVMTDNIPFRKTLRRLLVQVDIVLAALKNPYADRVTGVCLVLDNLLQDATATLAGETGVEALLLRNRPELAPILVEDESILISV